MSYEIPHSYTFRVELELFKMNVFLSTRKTSTSHSEIQETSITKMST